MTSVAFLSQLLKYVWAGPNSCLGLMAGVLAAALGARIRVVEGALEIAGGRLGRLLARAGCPFGAITLGHVILGIDVTTLARVRAHEHVHIRQAELLGPLFLPAYLSGSLLALLQGRRPYLDNPFEVVARKEAGQDEP